MAFYIDSLARTAFWLVASRVVQTHAGPNLEIVCGNTRPYLDTSLAVNPGMVNGKQKRPAGNQFDTPEESLAAEAHSTPFDWRVQLTGDAKFPSDRKKQRTGELDGWDFLSLGIPHNTEYLSIPTGISQESPSKQIGLMFDKTHLQHDSRSQDDLENEGHPGNRISKSTLIDFFGPKFQYNNKENGNSPIEDHRITQESDLKGFSGENVTNQSETNYRDNAMETNMNNNSSDGMFHQELSQGGNGKQDRNVERKCQFEGKKNKWIETTISEKEMITKKRKQNHHQSSKSEWMKWANEILHYSNTRLPQGMIDHSFLAEYTKKFQKELKEEFSYESTSATKSLKRSRRKLHPNIVFCTKGSYYVNSICVYGMHKERHVKSAYIFTKIEKLISWLLYINESVLIHLEIGSKVHQDHSSSHHEIVDWLCNLLFHPPNSHLPLLGRVHDINKVFKESGEANFGKNQLVLLEYICSDVKKDQALDKSLTLLCHYCQEFKPEMIPQISNFNFNQGLKDNLTMLTYRSFFESKMTIKHVIEDGRIGLIEARRLELFNLENINPRIWNKTKSLFKINRYSDFKPGEKRIVEDLQDLFSRRRKGKYTSAIVPATHKPSENLPVSISNLSIDETGAMGGSLWVVKIGGEKICAQRIKDELVSLMVHLRAFRFYLMKSDEFAPLRPKESLSEKYLLEWLHDHVLMTDKEDELPLLGEFKLRNRRHFSEKPLDCSEFSEAQVVLMDHLSKVYSHPSVVQLAIYLLGYWYKDQEKEAFTEVFHDDHDYWLAAEKILHRKFQGSLVK